MSDSAWQWDVAWQITPILLDSLKLTLWVTVVGSFLAWILGLLLAAGRLSRNAVLSFAAREITDFVRGTPFLIQLFFVFYVFPYAGIMLSPFLTGVLVLGMYYGAYASDTFRASILAVPKPILESCVALNLSRRQAWMRILLPLAMRASIPPLMNYFAMCFKETSLLVVIGLPILLGKAQEIGYESFRYLEAYTIAGIIFIVLTLPVSYLVRRLEARHVFD